jgi:repressor LexA
MARLTDTQNKALSFIRSSISQCGIPPTLREICGHMGYSAIGSAQDLINALRKKGFLAEGDKYAARSYVLTPLVGQVDSVEDSFSDPNTFVIPCLGSVPAGNPLEALEDQVATIRMSISMLPRPLPRPDHLFGLQASGQSMIEAGILDGDWLVIKSDQSPAKGSIVVARLEDDATVKRLMSDTKRGFYLKPENPDFENIFADEHAFEIVGQVIALQRSL